MRNFNLEPLGGGTGLRHPHFEAILEHRPRCNWFEVIIDDFLGGGRDIALLKEIRHHYPVIGHGVGLSIGSTDPLDHEYLRSIRRVLDAIGSPWYSDHLCFTMVDHTNLNDLIPLPFTREAVDHVVERARVVQDILERPFLLENVTRYITVSDREMPEQEFLTTILERANCGLLLDVTNVYLNGQFHRFDPLEFIRSLPIERVGQMHLSGWEPAADGRVVDSHDAPVPDAVWHLFEEVVQLTGPSSVLIERDDQLPSLTELLSEATTADVALRRACGGQRGS